MGDGRVVYGARCSWWDSIDRASSTGSGLPCCPYCKGPLYEVESADAWWADVRRYEADGHGHEGYEAFVTWLRGRCYQNTESARAQFDAECQAAEALGATPVGLTDPRPHDMSDVAPALDRDGLTGPPVRMSDREILVSGHHVEAIGIPREGGGYDPAVIFTLEGRRNQHPDEEPVRLRFVLPAHSTIDLSHLLKKAGRRSIADVGVAMRRTN